MRGDETEWKDRTEPCLWTNDIAVAHAFVVAGGGANLHTLVISDGMYKRGRDGEDLVDDFWKHCPNVTSLSVAEEMDPIWRDKFGSQLEILEVYDEVPLSTPENAPVLRELNMSTYVGNFNTLRRVGESLQTLIIHGFDFDCADADFDYIRLSDFDKIRLHCPNLKSVSLKGEYEEHSNDIARLLASYGDRLEYALLHCFNDDQIRDVTAACPNARFHLTGGISLSGLNLIGPRLEGVNHSSVVDLYMNDDLGEWINAWNQCVNLRHLEFAPNRVEEFQAVFSSLKKHLVSIELKFGESFKREDVKKAMVNLANGTKCVEKLNFYGPPCFIDEFDGFIRKNRATLRYIELGASSGTFSAGNKRLEELLKSFLHLPALEELYVDYEIPQNILTSLRNKGVYCGREYL